MTPLQAVLSVLETCHIDERTSKAELRRIATRIIKALKDLSP